jgi:hypothetical protein
MGLMYIFPVNNDEADDRSEILTNALNNEKKIVLKSYGLPLIFWGYLSAALIVIASMWLASKPTINKLLSYDDPGLLALGFLVKYTLFLSPIILLGFFFYEKQIHKTGKNLNLIFKIFYIPFFSKNITLDATDSFTIGHYMDSPNMAKIYNKSELKAFENKGYFELHAISSGKNILIDRHSRKADLVKIKELLSQY